MSNEIGTPVRNLQTPVLLIDLDVMERNLEKMSSFFRDSSVNLRPHSKTHKSPIIAKKQIELGANGICCQKVSEAEIMVQGGIEDILLSSEIVSPEKLERVSSLIKNSDVMLVVDHIEGAELLSKIMEKNQTEIGVLVDIDVGQGRCGVRTVGEAVVLAKKIDTLPWIHLCGFQAYNGKAQHIEGFNERGKQYSNSMDLIQESIFEFDRNGLNSEVKTGGGTGTWNWDLGANLLNEVQAGSYLFMDSHYTSIGSREGDLYEDFEASLFVLATIISFPEDEKFIVDAGHKSLSSDSGFASCHDYLEAIYISASDEHGIISMDSSNEFPKLGDPLLFQPSHCDTTVNLFDCFHGIRGGMDKGFLEVKWPISARGMVQ
ncbi:MAG: DSD1 family PLP-dependent enzyme [Nitrospinota bacterium]|nr:DSD1 family PLP-dependent enzyme [Nitrospinota bacterium]